MNTPDQLDLLVRDTLAGRADDAPAAGPVVDRVLADGVPRRSPGRLPLVAAGIAASVAAGAFGAAALWPGGSPTQVATQPGTGSGPGGGVLERCLDFGAEALPAAHWGAGSRVLTSASAGGQTRAVLVSADGRQWADCHLLTPGSDQGLLETYPMEPAEQGVREYGPYTTRTGGPLQFSMVDRFPDNVAEVHLVLESGAVHTAEAVDGFVAFQIEGDAPDDLDQLLQYDAEGELVGGPGMGPGDADLPKEQRSLVPDQPLDSVVVNDNL